jgi:hypothetical protein
MAVAPLIRPIRLQGGTFYTFSSASEDLGLTFNDSQKKFRFSRFALLDLPPIENSSPSLNNTIGLSNVPGGFEQIDGSKTWNDYFAESFQNYCLNLEATLTGQSGYDPNVDRTVSERVFFKWMKEVGAMRFRDALPAEYVQSVVTSNPTKYPAGKLYVEEDDSAFYRKVVRYIADVSIINSVRNSFNAFSEVYLYIPTSHGNTPKVLFNSLDDANYPKNGVYQNTPANPLNAAYLFGRDTNTVSPAGLSTEAYYDSVLNTFTVNDPYSAVADFYYFDPVTNAYIQQSNPGFSWWFGANPYANSYFLEPTATFNDSGNDRFKIESVNKSVEFVRNRLDGISLVYDETVYTGMVNQNITEFGKYNEDPSSQTFPFNAVLVYYDLYDPNTPANFTTNLFGVLFLDNVDPKTGGGGFIPQYTKYKPNSLTGDNGNSFAFRVNIKFDVNTQDTSIETSINDYNPYSLSQFMEAINQLLNSSSLLESNQEVLIALQNQVTGLENQIINAQSAAEIEQRLNDLETLIQQSQQVFINNQNLVNMLQGLYQEVNNIYAGVTSVEVSYNLDLLQSGPGIFVDKTSPGAAKIINTRELFTIGDSTVPTDRTLITFTTDFVTNPSSYSYLRRLLDYNNYLKILGGTPSSIPVTDRDIIIYIDDTIEKWKKGQVLRIAFENGIDMSNVNGNFNFIIYSDALDTLNTGFPYSAEIGFVTYSQFAAKGENPIIELICLDPSTYQFSTDIF